MITELHRVLQQKLNKTKHFQNMQSIQLSSSDHITKLVDAETNTEVDVLINSFNGISNTKVIQNYLKAYQLLKYLVIVLKQFLRERDFNENYTGGISSCSLILMIVSFLQRHHKPLSVNDESNLGTLLIEFFELYVKRFTYSITGIMTSDNGKHVPKHDLLKQMKQYAHKQILCVEDPSDPTVNVGKSSCNILRIKEAFAHAYQDLTVCVLPHYGYLIEPGYSILGRIIHISDKILDHRKLVSANF